MTATQVKVKIISNRKIKNNCWRLELDSGAIARSASPGQFLEIKVCDEGLPLLRRPISIHGVNGSRVQLIYEVVGSGTRVLSGRRKGEFLDIIGPLGKGFEYGRKPVGKSVLVAGGMGVAPLLFLARRLKPAKPLVLIGAGSKEQLLCLQEFKAFGCRMAIATDDGSAGFKGKVTEMLDRLLREMPDAGRPGNIYACGPQPMLKAVAKICRGHNISSQLSLERHMACGFGACLGCVVSTKSGYKRVCKEGPVFKGEELVW
ncbi:MAG: dihydroorotate dehydrogenase electron transfer subunit [Candidatus Omnitrophica bacterium]|nr:dihydroorotate dehydrogenase electron transfer subunit [Candidatus Omnitrophota bacterium]MDD5771264.1 dihydroorotate dehydrogenase electron transfer subunit [Candidatus Omnitrophota bacterium]